MSPPQISPEDQCLVMCNPFSQCARSVVPGIEKFFRVLSGHHVCLKREGTCEAKKASF